MEQIGPTEAIMNARASLDVVNSLTIQYRRNPFANLSNKLYAPYTNAELSDSVPITSDINDVLVFSIIAIPIPQNAESGYTHILLSLFKKYRGTEETVRIKMLTRKGFILSLRTNVIFLWMKMLKNILKINVIKGTTARGIGVGFSSVTRNSVTSFKQNGQTVIVTFTVTLASI